MAAVRAAAPTSSPMPLGAPQHKRQRTSTLLSLAGVEYDAPFFGDDLLGLPDEGGRAFVNHNRSVGVLTDTDNTGGSVEAWYGDIRFRTAER